MLFRSIFATDVNESAIEKARAGWYPESIALDVSADRLRRFFVKRGRGYQINKAVRDFCVCEPPRPKPVKPAGTRGRGLFIVSVVSSAWGVEEHADGKTIWAVLTAPDHRG